MKTPTLVFIVGQTASGKTGISLVEAERTGASILSCDSLCVYRGMDIGTAKPTLEEQERIPHYGLDLCDPARSYSVADYMCYRDKVLEAHRKSGRPLIVAGGSGFYLKSFFSPVIDTVNLPEEVQLRVEAVRETEGLEGLVKLLRSANPVEENFEGLDWQNGRRVEKAALRCLATGKTYSALLREFSALPDPLPGWKREVWMVRRSSEILQERNRRRVVSMLDAGLVDEVRALRKAGFERNPSACKAIGYREVLEYLDGVVDEDQMRENIILHTRQLMRKQRTWFRRQLPVDREIEPESEEFSEAGP